MHAFYEQRRKLAEFDITQVTWPKNYAQIDLLVAKGEQN